MKNPHLVTQALLVLLIGLQAAGVWLHPAAPPAPSVPAPPAPSVPDRPASSSLADAARAYRDGLPAAFAGLRDGVKSGQVQTKVDGVAAFSAPRRPLADALNLAFDAHCDEAGKITDAAGLGAELDRAAKALGAK